MGLTLVIDRGSEVSIIDSHFLLMYFLNFLIYKAYNYYSILITGCLSLILETIVRQRGEAMKDDFL